MHWNKIWIHNLNKHLWFFFKLLTLNWVEINTQHSKLMSENLENAILSNLEKLKKESQISTADNEAEDLKETEKLVGKLTRVTDVKRSDFDFESKRAFFDEVYFKHSKIFRPNCKEYTDFWAFVKKYQAMMKRRPAAAAKEGSKSTRVVVGELSARFHLPVSYDKRWRLNFVYRSKKETFAAYDWQGKAITTDVSEEQLKEFELIVHLYLDFCQKEKFRKLQKLREAQSNLPVYKYRQVILDTVKQNQITIIAGDTGCGKVKL